MYFKKQKYKDKVYLYLVDNIFNPQKNSYEQKIIKSQVPPAKPGA